MKKIILGSAVAAALSMGVSTSANAALSGTSILNFDNGVSVCNAGAGTFPNCSYGSNVPTGSYFGMDTNGNGTIQNGEKNAIVNAGTGLTLGTAQAIGAIDNTWSFGGNPGNHYSQTAVTVASASGNSATLNMSGWIVNWNGGDINMGQGAPATVTCGVDCSVGDTFALDYSATVPSGGFKGFFYTLHMAGTVSAGTVSAVPVPAAVWLFGSGLLGLAGVARRRKAA